MACGTFQLASACRAAGVPVAIVPGAYDPHHGLDDLGPLERVLGGFGDCLLGITVLEGGIAAARALARFGADRGARVVLGGPRPPGPPAHALAHGPHPHAAVSGPGEGVLPTLARQWVGSADRLPGVLVRSKDELVGDPTRRAVVDPDDTPMDFGLLEARHLVNGLSLETGRGCAHACLFCTTPGRGRYQGRSPAAVAGHLAAYVERLAELYGDDVPRIARRIQICDDDFACDADRAIAVLAAVRGVGLELGPLQASVRDFLRPDGGLRDDLLDALAAAPFQDRDAASAARTGTLPAGTDAWVHLGVESFADPDLRRLGKGYDADQARAVVRALGERGVVCEAYLIAGNRGTTPGDLVDSLTAVAQLKLEHPHTFFLRTPPVARVVPAFPSALFRKGAQVELARTWTAEAHPQLDLPEVACEWPEDPDVDAVCDRVEALFEPDDRYLAPLAWLRAFLLGRLPAADEPDRAAALRVAIRRLDDVHRRLACQGMARARQEQLPGAVAGRYWAEAEQLGAPARVAAEVRNAMMAGDPRLVVIPTRDCSLRCAYCPADKQPGQEMTPATLQQTVELLLSSDRRDVILQFFGGEALLRRDLVMQGMDRAMVLAAQHDKRIGFIVSTNGLSLDRSLIDELSRLPVKVEISLDGRAGVQDHHRVRPQGGGSYDLVTRHADRLLASGLQTDVIMVVTPATVDRLCDSFAHLVELGFPRVQVNHGLAVHWSREALRVFAAQLRAVEERFYGGSLAAAGVDWIDLRTFRDPMLLNGEITVDHDGTVYFGNGFLIRTADPARFRAGRLDDLACYDSYALRRPDNAYLVKYTYPPEMAANTIEAGRVYGSFVRHMRQRFPELEEVEPTRRPRAIREDAP